LRSRRLSSLRVLTYFRLMRVVARCQTRVRTQVWRAELDMSAKHHAQAPTLQ
jgi:hypothetical protein